MDQMISKKAVLDAIERLLQSEKYAREHPQTGKRELTFFDALDVLEGGY